MPFIDLSALNPLSKKSDDGNSQPQSQAAQDSGAAAGAVTAQASDASSMAPIAAAVVPAGDVTSQPVTNSLQADDSQSTTPMTNVAADSNSSATTDTTTLPAMPAEPSATEASSTASSTETQTINPPQQVDLTAATPETTPNVEQISEPQVQGDGMPEAAPTITNDTSNTNSDNLAAPIADTAEISAEVVPQSGTGESATAVPATPAAPEATAEQVTSTPPTPEVTAETVAPQVSQDTPADVSSMAASTADQNTQNQQVQDTPTAETPMIDATVEPQSAPAETPVPVSNDPDMGSNTPSTPEPVNETMEAGTTEATETVEPVQSSDQLSQSQPAVDPVVAPMAAAGSQTQVEQSTENTSAPETSLAPVTTEESVTLQPSSSSAESGANLDKEGNPIPAISAKKVNTDETGIVEVKGPEFETPSQPPTPPVQQLESQTVEERISSMDVSGLEGAVTTPQPTPATPAPAAAPTTPTPAVAPEAPANNQGQTTATAAAVPSPTPAAGAPNSDSAPLPDLAKQEVKEYSLNELLHQAVEMGASDLHLTAGYRAVVRVDGELQNIQSQILSDESIKALVKDVVAEVKVENPEDIRDLDLAYQSPDGNRFRVNIFKQQGTQSAVFRLIPTKIKTLEELSLPAKLKDFTQMSQGLILVTGPTGSGKSTTLSAMVNEINMNDPRHIITIEDPIEFVYPKGRALVDQRGIKQDTDDWEDALRSVLRQDPDVVLIGEMRDLETISAALHIAETGHLVFGTLHTNSAAQSIDRIIDVFPKEQQAQIQTQLATVLKAVVSQRLVPLKAGGRKVSVEIMISTPAVSNSIRSSKVYQIDNIIQTSGDLGMISMEKSLAELVRSGAISTEQAQFYANKSDEVLSLLGKKS